MDFTLDNSFGHPPRPPPPDNDKICGHNAMLAFPQENISHYTTVWVTPACSIDSIRNLRSAANHSNDLSRTLAREPNL